MWRNTALPIRFLMLDARALLPVLCFVTYWSWTTLYIALLGTALALSRCDGHL
ncbi:IcmT/TraK family protein (plasmid) [Roseomonas mucosa]|nr:IcmT/TraK family protein [Roseomonas mucosa]